MVGRSACPVNSWRPMRREVHCDPRVLDVTQLLPFAAYPPSEEGDDTERFSDGFRVECLEIVDDISKGH